MEYKLLKLIRSHGLTGHSGASRIARELEYNSLTAILDQADVLCREITPPGPDERFPRSVTFRFPAVSPVDLSRITPYLFISEKAYIDDPLYQAVAHLEQIKLWEAEVEGVLDFGLAYAAIAEEICAAALFLESASDLIAENRLIPFKQLTYPSGTRREWLEELSTRLPRDAEVRRIIGPPPSLLRKVSYRLSKAVGANSVTHRLHEHAATYIARYIRFNGLIESLTYSAISRDLSGLNVDLLSLEAARLLRSILKVAEKWNLEKPAIERISLPASFTTTSLRVPVLHGVPLVRVLDCINLEPEAFKSFQSAYKEALLNIDAPIETGERDTQIERVSQSIQKEVYRLNTTYRNIQKQYQRKVASNLLLGACSVMVGSFAAVTRNLDALTVAQSIVAGSGVGSAAKDILKAWLGHKQDLDNLRSSDYFFLWRVLRTDEAAN